MGLFNRIFGQKQEAPPERISESVHTLECYVIGIMKHYGESHFLEDALPKQLLSVYSFGGVSALAIQHKMSPPQAHAVCMALFAGVFGFTPADTAAKAQAVITAAPDRTSHLYPTIHRGLNGFLHWQKNQDDGAAEDFAKIVTHIQNFKP
jgi:hypothetical protein